MVNNPLIRPLFLGEIWGWHWEGGPLRFCTPGSPWPPLFHRLVLELHHFSIVRVYHHPKGTNIFLMVATTSNGVYIYKDFCACLYCI